MMWVMGGLLLAAILVAIWVWAGKERYEYIQDLARHASEAQASPVEPWEAPRIVRGPYDWERRGDFDG